ncbi:MAG: LexA family protein [Methylobacter sp.]
MIPIISNSNLFSISHSDFNLSYTFLMTIKEPYEDFGKRFQELVKDKETKIGRRLRQPELAKAFGCKQSFISQMKTGKKLPSTDTSIAMRDYFDCSIDWLLSNKGDKYGLHIEASNVTDGPPVRGFVPLISSVPAGDWREAIDNYHPGQGEKMVAVTVPVNRHTFAVRVTGDSMEPEFVEGEIVIVEPDLQPEHRDYVIARNGGDVTLKQLWRESGEWFLKPLNNRYPIKSLLTAEIIGVVREKTKMYR